jgi:hypothetical protein
MQKDNVIKAAVISGIFVVLAAIIGALVTHWFGGTTPSAPTASRGSASNNATITSPAASASAAIARTSRGIYHQGTLKVAYSTCVDLDAPPSDPQWGVASVGSSNSGVDLCSDYPSFSGTNSATIVTVTSGTDTTCQNATGWLPTDSYQNLPLSTGSFLCVHTNQGRFSLLRVTAIDATAGAITFQVKTFT